MHLSHSGGHFEIEVTNPSRVMRSAHKETGHVSKRVMSISNSNPPAITCCVRSRIKYYE